MASNRPHFLTVVAVLGMATFILDCSAGMQSSTIIQSTSSPGGSPIGGGGSPNPSPTPTPAGQISVNWGQTTLNTDGSATNISGYKLYFGTTSGGPYTGANGISSPISTGPVMSYTMTLTPGNTYYFVVSTVNSAGVESAQSSELTYKVP